MVLGTQWGDEGKGKLVDILAQKYDVVARAQASPSELLQGAGLVRDDLTCTACTQGGANAGHTVYDDKGTKYALHLVPSGILNPQAQCIVGNGVVVHLPTLFEEMDTLQQQGVSFEGRFLVSDRCARRTGSHMLGAGADISRTQAVLLSDAQPCLQHCRLRGHIGRLLMHAGLTCSMTAQGDLQGAWGRAQARMTKRDNRLALHRTFFPLSLTYGACVQRARAARPAQGESCERQSTCSTQHSIGLALHQTPFYTVV